MAPATRWRITALAAAAVLTGGTGCGAKRIGEKQEIRLGQRTAQQIERQYRTETDPAVSRIGQELAAASKRPTLPWSFKAIDRPEVNAVSLPGGPVYLFRGLLGKIASDEGMLAAVLGHEIGHVERRHAVRQIQRAEWYGLGAAVLEQAAGGDVGAISQVAANLHLLSWSRKQEYEADDTAIRLMRRTNRNPEGLVRLLQLLRAQEDRSPGLSWLRTHPTSAARIERARERIAATP